MSVYLIIIIILGKIQVISPVNEQLMLEIPPSGLNLVGLSIFTPATIWKAVSWLKNSNAEDDDNENSWDSESWKYATSGFGATTSREYEQIYGSDS